ncbi:MAG: hypothetical protein JJ911_00825 [Rhizobiaceae bacterium]|nr:hypothetical protein [Rhizobiaceae bacterium]
MPDTPKDKNQEKGDEVLRRLLKTPPDPKTGKGMDRTEKNEQQTDKAKSRPQSRSTSSNPD